MNNGQKSLSINETFIIESIEDSDILSACTGFYTNALISCSGNTQILLSNNIIKANSAFSATTFYGDGSNLTGISTQDTFVTGGTYNSNSGIATFTNNTGGTFSVNGFYTGSTDIYITGVTFSNNLLSLYRNDGVILGANINSFTSLTVNGSVSATTFYGDGSNLTGISTQDTFVTGGTYSDGTALFTNNTGGTFNVSGFYTGATDVFVTGATKSNDVATFVNNTGGTFTLTGLTDTIFTGGTVAGSTIFTNGLTANTFALSTTPNTNTTDTDVLVRNQSTGAIEQRSINSLINVVNLVTVGLSGSTGVDYYSVKEAVDSITGATYENTYVVKVGPGVFYEDPITMKSYVDVIGESETNTIIQANDPNTSLIIGADQSMVSDVQIQGCTGTSVAAVVYSSPTTPQLNAIFYVENVRFGANYTHAKTVGTSGGNCIMQCSNVKYGGYPFTLGFYVTNDGSGVGRMQLRNVTSTNGGVTTTSGLIFAKADQPNCAFIVNGCLLTKATGAAAGTGFWVENGGSLRLTAVNFQRWETAIYAPQVGSAPSIEAIALNFENCTTDVNVIHSGATGKIQGTDNYVKTLININAPLYEVNQDPRIITVAKKGGDFSSVKSAVDSITGSSSNNRFLISVGPGRFSEGEIDLSQKPYISIKGSDLLVTEIVPNTNTQHIFKIGQYNELSFLSLSGAPSGYAGIYVYDTGIYSLAHKLSFTDCDTNIWVESHTQYTSIYGEFLDFNGEYSYGTKIIAYNGYVALANIENYYNFPTGTGTTIANHIQGSGATLSVFGGDGIGNGASGSTNYQILDYGSLNTISTTAYNWDYGIRVLNIGGPSRFDVDSYSVVDSLVWDLSVEHPNTFGTFGGGSASHAKINNLSNDVYWAFLDIEDGEFDITRKISITFQDNTHTDVSTLVFEGSTMGLFDGGTITSVGGLTVHVSTGFGYLGKTIGNGVYMRIDWDDTEITLSPDTENYLYFNENYILSTSSNAPDSTTNIILGRVVTDSTELRFIDVTPYNARHTSNLLSTFNRNALGPIYATGSIVTENATPYFLDVSSGNYYFSENNFLPSGGEGIKFTEYYRDGSTGWISGIVNQVVNGYDDNSGSIVSLPLSSFTKHTLYIVGDGDNEQYMLVLGQTYYTTLVEAEGADLPTPPTYFDDGVTSIASIVVQEGEPNIIEILDIRPVIGFKATGISATAIHGNLLGLNADDHQQYLLVDGARAMTGNLSMGGNAISNALTVNGVTVETHASRHKNGGADEIASATPAPSEIPKADSFGKLDGWISDASTTVKGLTRLSQAPASASVPIAVGVNDPRFLNSITAVTNTTPSLVFTNNSGGTTTISNLRMSGVSATTISATTYQNLPLGSIATSGTTLYSTNPSTGNFNTTNSIFLGSNAGNAATSAFNSNFLGQNAGNGATNASSSNFLGANAGSGATNASSSNFLGINAGLAAINASSSNFIGSQAGRGATGAQSSNFFGSNAGLSATAASNSNFLGQSAGNAATNAFNSNFIGQQAGSGATIASHSNFFGFQAGLNAINANNSNFIGQSAGSGATDAIHSNFLGQFAGQNATTAQYSNFFGFSAGRNATTAQQSNFLGQLAGSGATNASNSNFFGISAGRGATAASNSNFLGQNAGQGATSASNSNFLGQNAGQGATSAQQSNFLGQSAGAGATSASQSNFLGIEAGYSATTANSSNFFGYQAGYQATSASASNFMGYQAGQQAINASFSTFMGWQSGYQATGASYSNFIGYQAGYQAINAGASNFIGGGAGVQATNANNSNFLGQGAGYGATDAYDSNFMGRAAGSSAINASNSNFFGFETGYDATNADGSNFIGKYAGYQATNASNSNFLGINAGNGATSAPFSNFLGTSAGRGATSASNSNFLGQFAGNNATNASSSNFIGNQAGRGATGAQSSNFFGLEAGLNATGASNSNFFGESAGQGATGANNSNFIGFRAGRAATNASYSNFFGIQAGQQAINANNSSFIGQNAGYQATGASFSNFIGDSAGNGATGAFFSNFIGAGAGSVANNAFESNFFGTSAGGSATGASYSNFLGTNAGLFATNAFQSNFLGQSAGAGSENASYSNFIGRQAGQNATNASFSNFIGDSAGGSATGASYSTLIGYNVGSVLSSSNSIGSNNIIIGTNITLPTGTTNSINLGGVLFGSNTYSTPSGTPSLSAQTNGRIGINVVTPTEALHVSGNTRIQGGLTATTISATTYLNLPSSGGAFTGGTVSGATIFTNGLTANTISATTYQNLPLGSIATTGTTLYSTNPSTSNFNTTNSIFLGSDAGNGATGASNSNFFGLQAGNFATSASNSNFIGSFAGFNATNASNSNFFGVSAGINATNANNSNFIGQQAGSGAASASNSNFLGASAGFGATSASLSNFLGSNAGNGATGATNSSFFGNQAGFGATNASNSNFIGQQAGNGATNAFQSNFFGFRAGDGATGAQQSNFLGINAGSGATSASASNFLGQGAGQGATSAAFSNFLGSNTGRGATSATNSNFLGQSAGSGATNATNSNFLGNNAGLNATGATNSNFFGSTVGNFARDANNSNFFGFQAGSGATGANNSNFFGNQSGFGATGATNSNFLGSTAGQNARSASNSNFFGSGSGVNATSAFRSNFLGENAGQGATNASSSNFFGSGAGFNATGASLSNFFGPSAGYFARGANNSNFIGNFAGFLATNAFGSNFFGEQAGRNATGANNSNFLGLEAGRLATNAFQSNFLGAFAGYEATVASFSNFFGYQVGSGATGSNNIIIGTNISLTGSDSINIGGVLFGTGTYAITAGTPSLSAQTNGRIGINVVTPTEALHVSGNTRIQGGLSATTISATTYLGISTQDTFVSGGTYSDGTATFTNNTGGTFNVNGFYTGFTGGTVSGVTNFNGGLGVGVAVPTTRLHISGTTAGDSGLRLETLTSVTPVSLGQAIGVDGNGNIVTISNVSGSTGPRPITTVTVDTTLTDLDQVVIVNSTTPITITLPQITISGRFITIKNVNTGVETILPYSGQLIDGDTSVIVARQNVSLDFQSYNNNWYLI